jgi:para-aminobenzoate synthetase component I
MSWSVDILPYETDAFAWFRRLEDQQLPFILESQGAAQQRYDIIGANPSRIIRAIDGEVRIDQQLTQLDPFAAVEETVRQMAPNTPCPLDLPFQGGAVGFFGYELMHSTQMIRRVAHANIATKDTDRKDSDPGDLDIRDLAIEGMDIKELDGDGIDLVDMLIGIYEIFIIIDHALHQTFQVCTPGASAASKLLWHRLLASERLLEKLDFKTTSAVKKQLSIEQYHQSFEQIKDYIHAGDCYQVNFTQRFSASYQGNPVGLYEHLRQTQKAPFSACLRMPNADILSFSPERLVRVVNGKILTQPIKGTRPRHRLPIEDQRLANELQSSEKDRAENLMIVDLLRNDLGKTAIPASIQVDKLFELVSFANVHHLVSSVSGELRSGLTAMDLLRACFPGGSVTGAPKQRAMEIIAELEPVKRQVYCGAIGYYSFHGDLDTNLPIRTLVCSNDTLHYWGGGGIVADSEVEQEYEESLLKVNFISHLLAKLRVDHST